MEQNYSHIELNERCEIYHLYENGQSLRQIAAQMRRSPSTISRELRRNRLTVAGYKPGTADRMAMTRKRRGSKIERLNPLRTYVLDGLAMERTPEQIVGRLRLEQSEHKVSVETIYAWIYGPDGRRRKLHKLLPKGKSTRGRRARRSHREPPIPNRWPIHMRPTKAHLRSELGHWEADLMHFSGQPAALLTCVERRSRFLLATKLDSKKSETTINALTELLKMMPPKTLKTMTLDNGGEFYQHQRLPLQAFFCDPHSPWQRGSIENANGVLRRSLPRKTNIARFTDQDIHDIMWTYNTTPRKCLGFYTPLEAFVKSMGVALEI